MTPTVEEESADRAIGDSIRSLELPALSQDVLARIIARRESGERIALPVARSANRNARTREWWVSGALVAAAAVVIAVLGVDQRTSSMRDVAASDVMSRAPADSVCGSYQSGTEPSAIRRLMLSTFGVAVACGAETVPSPPVEIDGSQIVPATLVYGSRTVTDGVFTSEHAPSTYAIARRSWHGTSALLAVRDGPLITRVSLDSLTVTVHDLIPLHWASWYFTQHPIGVMRADFDSASVAFTMTGRVDTAGRFPYSQAPGRLPWEWTKILVIPALKLGPRWHGTIQLAAPYHPHVHAEFTQSWATIQLRVVGRESITVPAGTFDCWKLLAGPSDYQSSFIWVSTRQHFVVQTSGITRFNDTGFHDTNYLQHVDFEPSM